MSFTRVITQPSQLSKLSETQQQLRRDVKVLQCQVSKMATQATAAQNLDELRTLTKKLDTRVGFLVESRAREEIASIHGNRWARNLEVRGLAMLANMLLDKDVIQAKGYDFQSVREKASSSLALFRRLPAFQKYLSSLELNDPTTKATKAHSQIKSYNFSVPDTEDITVKDINGENDNANGEYDVDPFAL